MILINQEKLEELYISKGMTSREIAKKYNCSKTTILDRLELFNISKRKKNLNDMIILKPTFLLGWLCGAIIGDGCVHKYKQTYIIILASMDKEMIKIFVDCIKNIVPTAKINISQSKKSKCFTGVFGSKTFYNILKPFKGEDYRWTTPTFLTSEKSMYGFISGLFDTDGCITQKTKYRGQLQLVSKHREGLQQVKNFLENKGMKVSLFPSKNPPCYRMSICEKKSLKLFKKSINFQLTRKKMKLEKIIEKFLPTDLSYGGSKYSYHEYYTAIHLRNTKGMSANKISEKIGIPKTAIEGWIYGTSKPKEVHLEVKNG